jgi:glycosyltransferase involved in cell wall biosynthesis
VAYSKKPISTIALVYDYLLSVGGVETHLLSLLRHGDQSRYRWLVIAPTAPAFEAQVQALGAQVVKWKLAHVLDVVALIRLLRLLQTYHVDLVHIHSPRAALFGRVASRLLKLPVVVTVHLPSYYFVYGQNVRARCKRWMYRCVETILNYGLTNRLIYVSSHVCREALDLGLAPRGRTMVIENGIDLVPFASSDQTRLVREALGIPLEATVLCCVGRLDGQKGIDILLEAICILEPERRTLRVWLVGDGPQRTVLEAQSRQLGLEASVQFLGFRRDVPNLLKASDIFVLPSRYEAMPMTILEAMAAGLPSVVTNVGDNAFLVEHGVTGFVTPLEDPVALAEALRQLLADPALCHRMGESARQRVEAYSDLRMVQRIQEVYALEIRTQLSYR